MEYSDEELTELIQKAIKIGGRATRVSILERFDAEILRVQTLAEKASTSPEVRAVCEIGLKALEHTRIACGALELRDAIARDLHEALRGRVRSGTCTDCGDQYSIVGEVDPGECFHCMYKKLRHSEAAKSETPS